MNTGIGFAVLAGISLGVWSFLHDRALGFVSPLVGATLVSFIGMVIGILSIYSDKGISLDYSNVFLNYKGIAFIIFVGIFAFLIDFFTLKTFSTGIDISVGFPIIIVTSIISSLIFGVLFAGDLINFKKIFGILVSILGIYIILK